MKFYFYGDTGLYNTFSPSYVLNQKVVSQIVFHIAKEKPYTLTRDNLKKTVNMSDDLINEGINQLVKINAIDFQENKYKLNFSVFLEKDIIFLKNYLLNIGEVIGKKIISLDEKISQLLNKISCRNLFSKERLYYHVICDQIFDGFAFDYFSERKLFCVSKKQVDNRDYIIFSYEDCEIENEYSAKLLCSSNNYFIDQYIFNSFGDSNGNRCDVFRYFRLVDKALEKSTSFNDVNQSYLELSNIYRHKMLKRCGALIERIHMKSLKLSEFSEEDQKHIKFLMMMDYVKLSDELLYLKIPVFTEDDLLVIKEIAILLLDELYPTIVKQFEVFEKEAKVLTPLKHGIAVKEVLNELWHQIFGLTNDYLVSKGFVANPVHKANEGRYFKSFFITSINNVYE